MLGWRSLKTVSNFTSHRPRPVGSIRSRVGFSLLQRKALNGAGFKAKDVWRDAIAAFIGKHNERANRFVGASARSKAVNSEIQFLTYVIKH